MIGFPLLLIPLAIYNIIAFLMRDVSFAAPLFTVPLTSGTAWPVTLSDLLLALGIVLLLCEVIKGARPGAKYLTDHLLSFLVVCAAGAEFVLLPQFGTSTYFLLSLLALVDFLSGIALRARRGKHAAAVASRRSAREPEAPASEPQFNPAPAPRRLRGSGRRTGAAGSSRADARPSERCFNRAVAVAGDPVAGAAARPWYDLAAGRAAALNSKILDDLPGSDARARGLVLVRAVGVLRIGGRSPPQAAGLRDALGGCDQMGDEDRVGPGLARRPRPLRRCDHRHQRDTGHLDVLKDAIFRLLWSIAVQHRIRFRRACLVSGRCFSLIPTLARGMPEQRISFPAVVRRGFQIVYELCLGFSAKQALFLEPGITRHCPETRRP